ncbi:MAG TPA: prolyl oligopeptidase family serine peptidase [Gemmatimonadales bacterium]|nr:prolyl oligopeptidase family serine peptidase [Gemmatimonadales bacterium]
MRPSTLAVTGLALLTGSLGAQTPAVPPLATIMRGPEFVGRVPGDVRWSADSRWLYFTWLPPGTDWREVPRPYRIRAGAGAVPESLSLARMDTLGPLAAGGPRSPDRKTRVVEWRGDLYLVTLGTERVRRLTRTAEAEGDPRFAPDGAHVTFIRGDNAWRLGLADGAIEQLTDIRPGTAPAIDSTTLAQRKQLEADQRTLFGAIRDRLRADSLRKAERARLDSLGILPFYLGKDARVVQISVSPAGTAALVVVAGKAATARPTQVPSWVTKSGYVEDIESREKAGDEQEPVRVAYLHLADGAVTWLQPIPGDTTGVADQFTVGGWSDDGRYALLGTVTRDYKWSYIHAVDGEHGALAQLEALHDSAWVDGPCFQCMGWLPDGRAWFVSEATGYAHLYSVAANGSDRRQLTSGSWEVEGVQLLDDRKTFLLHTSEGSPFEQHAWTMPVAGGKRTRLTEEVGGHEVTVSPDGQWMVDLFSTANRPPDLWLQPARPGSSRVQLTVSPTAEFLAGPWIKPEIITIPASDGVGVPARIYRPADLGAKPNGAAVIFVHGAGYLHNVHRWWSSYDREYMFHHLLASRGYVVLDLDYRGSAGYGRDWRTAIYRHMGGRDLQDQVDASRWLTTSFGIPAGRIGIYGGSYGGFITLMALFTEGSSFGAGAALRSVTDWAHYNHGYTARILNTPQGDTLAFRRSSPIFFAEGLADPLLIAHGMVDTNVEFQDVVRLAQRLIELGKDGWELAVYPVENHGFVRPDSWTDEYRRILELFDRVLPDTGGGH